MYRTCRTRLLCGESAVCTGQAVKNQAGLLQGRNDVPLNEEEIRQAEEL